jgi:hypothetical protein
MYYLQQAVYQRYGSTSFYTSSQTDRLQRFHAIAMSSTVRRKTDDTILEKRLAHPAIKQRANVIFEGPVQDV